MNRQEYSLTLENIELNDGLVSLATGANEKIEKSHTHYTENDNGVKMFDCLTVICEKLDQLEEMTGIYRHGVLEPRFDGKITGIEFKDRKYRPNLYDLRRYEELAKI